MKPIETVQNELITGNRGILEEAILKATSDTATLTIFDANGNLDPNVDDCETAWTAKSNVTSTADTTIYKQGTASAKHVIAAGFSTGIISTYTISSKDLSVYDGLIFWIYSTLGQSAGVYQIMVDDTAACASALETINIPALTATTWRLVAVPFSSPRASGMEAVISVGLNAASDPGADTVYIDSISAVKMLGIQLSAPANAIRMISPSNPISFENGIYAAFTGTSPRAYVYIR